MSLEGKTEKRVVGKKELEVTVVVEQLTQEEAREMFSYRPVNKYAESRFGNNNTLYDDTAALLNGDSTRCGMCTAPTNNKYLIDNSCPDCDGRSEYHGTDPRQPAR